jgi:hypothetical protein
MHGQQYVGCWPPSEGLASREGVVWLALLQGSGHESITGGVLRNGRIELLLVAAVLIVVLQAFVLVCC